MASQPLSPEIREQNRALLGKLLVVVVVMAGFAWALIPLYRQICQVLGINQPIAAVEAKQSTQVDTSRTLTMELLASNAGGLDWPFAPVQREVKFHPGEPVEVHYRATNTSGRDMVARANFSMAPDYAARHLSKMACFCLDNQTFKAGETRDLVVVFRIDPAVPKGVERLSLSYTFFEAPKS